MGAHQSAIVVGAPHVQLLGEALLRSRRVAAGLVADTVPSETCGSYSGLFIETRNAHQRNRICISRSRRRSASCSVSIFSRDKYARQKELNAPERSRKVYHEGVVFLPSQPRYSLNMKGRGVRSDANGWGGGGLSGEVGGVARIPLTVIFLDISLRSSVSLCHPGSNFCAQ